ncbi:MAG: hypothetical protein HRT53_00735 [Colwellia sp.]|nr:hypothetical protein [Colwellia sp.]
MVLLQRLSFLLVFAAVVGCGGSGGSLQQTETPVGEVGDVPITIALTISNTTVTGAVPVTITAKVMQGTTAVANRAVTFVTDLGAFSPSSGSALSDENGDAVITLTAGSVRGAGEITASLTSGESSTVPLGFETQGDDIGIVGDINISVILIDSEGNPTDTVTSSKPARVIATINGISSRLIVTFSTTVGNIPIPSAITNDDNQAIVDIYAGDSLGAGTVTATITSGETGQVLLVVGSSTVEIGSGDPFVEGVASISLATISAGGTTVVSVIIVDDQGNNFAEPVDIEFSSGCTSQTVPTATLSSPVTTSNGIATSTYLAKGCVGADPINVTANAGGINLSATGVVNVLPADAGSIEFVSATPEYISILGTGSIERPENSTLVFRVLDTNGNPINNRRVDFSLNTGVGGVNLIPDFAITNSEGLVQTVVNSGSVSHTIRITASITDSEPLISTQSSNLIVSTGIPDQDSFTIAADILNPEAWDITGVEVLVTARLADAFNNPPPPTVVYFTTEGGSIGNSSADKQCTTDDSGACSVTWRSSSPRPEGHILGDANNLSHVPEVNNTMGQRYGGRVTILATVIGEESFADLNGNGRFDVCEVAAFIGGVGKPCNADGSINSTGADITYSGNDVGGQPYDLPEAYSDYNEDGIFNPSEGGGELGGELEEPSDFNRDGLYDGKDGLYNGVLCAIPVHDGCAEQKSVDVRDQIVLVMSGSTAYGTIHSTNDAVTATIDDDNDPNTPEVLNPFNDSSDSIVYIKGESVGSASIIIADLHNQPMPEGTVINFISTVGSVLGTSSFTWPNDNHNGGSLFGVSIKGEAEAKSGSLLVEVTTPGNVTTTLTGISIIIQ